MHRVYHLYIYIYIYIKSCWWCGVHWFSVAIRLKWLLLLTDLQDRIKCPHRAYVRKSLLVGQISVSMSWSPWEDVSYEFIFTLAVVPRMSSLSYLDGLWDERPVAEQLFFFWMLLLSFVQNNTEHSFLVSIKPFLHAFRLNSWSIRTVVLTQTQTGRNTFFISLQKSDPNIIDNLSIADRAFSI